MHKAKIVFTLGALIIFGAGCSVAPSQRAEKSPTLPPQAKLEDKNTVVVEMTAEGFNPPALSIKAGTTVKFVNKDTVPHWPASGMHPTHQICPGFDSMKGVAPGESYSFTFKEAKTCPMHDHLNPSMHGSITVEGE